MAHRKRSDSISSSSSSRSSSTSTSSEDSDLSTRPSTPPPQISSKCGRDASKRVHKSKKARACSPVASEKKNGKANRSRNKVLTLQEQCIHVARWIPRSLDMFCDLKQAIQVSLLLEQEAAEAEDGDETEEEHIKAAHRKILDSRDTLTCARYMCTFKYINKHAPYLGTLIGRRKKCNELVQLIGEMQNMINHVRSEDASRLKSRMGSYAAPNPDKELICLPITDDSKSHAQMGFNHAQLGKLLCPAKYLVEYTKDPHGMKNKFDSASLKVTAALWPAFLYLGNTAGEDFDLEDIIEGLFRGYLLERVTKHIFTSLSSALKAGVSSGTRTCNAKLHGMKEVGAEHITYAVVQACFAISSLEKWKDHDSLFYYTDFYTRIVNLIQGRKDKGWVDSLLGHYNEKLFGNENGARPIHSVNTECSEDDDMIAMEWQLATRASRSSDTPSAPSSALDNQQESRGKSTPPPQRSPTPDLPTAQALVNTQEDQQPSPLPPLSPVSPACSPTPEPPVNSCKEKVLPAHSLTPDLPVNSCKRKQTSTPVAAIFDDDSPLMEEDEEVIQPTKRKRKSVAVPPGKKASKRKSRK
ncbi:hypothetical protein EV702DRAFT_1205055 [Suillus placidus]|uniref:Uncharacterized protein n=1 Tax=Suillus placidus TaxID=48579 RepID=A0A9P6ZG09_9AGAM|nr:hypothetical protein EV702DRAFT_1205055 [Suillus placidus]